MKLELPKPVFVCQRCKLRFEREQAGPTECPGCGHLYVDWINYEKFAAILRQIEQSRGN